LRALAQIRYRVLEHGFRHFERIIERILDRCIVGSLGDARGASASGPLGMDTFGGSVVIAAFEWVPS